MKTSSKSRGRWITLASVLYLAVVLVVWLLIAQFGDRWWVATVLMFGPRWIWALPAVPLLVLALWRRSKLGIVAPLLALGLVLWPIMGWHWRFDSSTGAAADLRIVTFNIGNSYRADENKVDAPLLRRLFDITRTDLMFLQECSLDKDALFAQFPDKEIFSADGSCIVSNFQILQETARNPEDVRAMGGSGMAQRFDIATPRGVVSVVNLHLETVRGGMERVVARSFSAAAAMDSNATVRRLESAIAAGWAAGAKVPLLVVGDFNMPVESAIYRRYWSVLGNAFDDCGAGYGYTKFEKRYGIRIDHVLYDRRWACVRAIVDDSVGGDHRPLIVDLRRR